MELSEYVAALKPRMISSLRQNLRIPSVQGEAEDGAPYGIFVRKSLDHVLETARELGFRTENMDGHLGFCEYGEGEEMVAVLGHLDVVPAGDGWSCDPFGGELRGGKIWGRGATDDKGPAIASLYALAALRDSGLPIRRRIRILFGCNEETGSADMKYYLANGGEVPKMGFTPDGEYPVINGEKGIINVSFSRAYTQSGDIRLLSIRGGTAPNMVPAHACAKLACPQALAQRIARLCAPQVRFTATDFGLFMEAKGVSAHGSTPELGENAIGRLLLALDTLPLSGELADAVHFLAGTLGMGTDGASAGIALRDAVSGNLTLNLGTMEADEHRLSLKINYRYPVTKDYADCAPILNAKFAGAGFTLDSEVHKPKLYISEDSPLVSTLLKVYREQTGLEEPPKSIGGGTYAKALPNIVAFGPIFPGEEVREHKPDEYLSVDSLMKNARIIAAAMYEMAK
ncbi:MAG: dipeptidase PepV [Faecousia sp.]